MYVLSASKYTSARLSFAIYTDLYCGVDVLFSRQGAPRDRRDTFDSKKEVRRRQAPLASNYRTGFS